MRINYKPFTVCKVEGCYLLTRSHDLCKVHAYRLAKYGDATYVKPKKTKL